MTVLVLVLPVLPLPRELVGSDAGARLLAAIEHVLTVLPEHPTLAVLAAGTEPLVEDVHALALPGRTVPVAGAPDVVAAVVERGQVPLVRATALSGSAGALAGVVHAARPDARFLGVTVASRSDPAAIDSTAAALDGALAASGDVVLLVPGDLAVGGHGASDAAADHAVAARLRDALERQHPSRSLARSAADRPATTSSLAPVRLAVRILEARGERLQVHAVELGGGALRVVGASR